MLESADQMTTILKHMQTLPEQQQTVIQLRDIDGYEYEEMAAIMGMNVNAIRVTLSRARNSIREHLIKIGNYGHPANQNPAFIAMYIRLTSAGGKCDMIQKSCATLCLRK
jgi:hypothetical protein